ncbi:MAG: hypothetical protein ACI9VR_004851 [Cognaticolwellia sp.]|jgi:hypothetical protein
MLLLLAISWAKESPESHISDWEIARPFLEAHSKGHVPVLSQGDLARLRSGKTIGRRLESEGEVDGALGIAFMPLSTEAVWVGGLDDRHAQLAAGLTEVWLPGTNTERKILYQHLDVPQPFSDRHWVVQIRSNAELYAASEGKVWERYWDLDPRPLSDLMLELPEGAIELESDTLTTPVNRGRWTIVRASDGVFVLYEVFTDIGGPVPEELMVRFAMLSLNEFMGTLEEVGTGAPEHYAGDHYIIRRPDLSPIQPGAVPKI